MLYQYKDKHIYVYINGMLILNTNTHISPDFLSVITLNLR